MVAAIFSASLPLSNPDGLMLFEDAVVDIRRKLLGGFKAFAQTRVAFYDETLIEPDKVGDPIIDEKIVADRHFRRRIAPAEESRIKKRRVEDDVAMVGDERMAHRRIQILHASERNAGSGGLGEHLQEGEHHLRLKIMLIVDLQQFLNQR